VDPIIWAAIISGGWAAVVAALGYRFNRVTAKATTQATNSNALAALDAAHQAQLWEKKAEAYVAAIAAITRRQAARFHLTRMLRFDDATEEKLRESYAAPEDCEWANVSARLSSFAPPAILDAMTAANVADQEATASYGQWRALTEQRGSLGPSRITGSQTMTAFGAVETAMAAASEADKALEALIRADLALKPSDRASRTPAADAQQESQPSDP
jgi:hypothetical protein